MPNTKFSEWLEKQYIRWLSNAGQRRTQRQFAEWLGISTALLSHYLRGSRNPSEEYLEKIALRLGDEAYDAVGVPRPDPQLRAVKNAWSKLTDEQKTRIGKILDEP